MIRNPFVAALTALALLAACGTAANDPVRGSLLNSLKQLTNRGQQEVLTTEILRARLTPEVRAQIGQPMLIAELPKLKVGAVVVAVAQNGPDVTWFAPDGVGVTTKSGVLVSTRGIGFDLMASDVAAPLAVITGPGRGSATRVQIYLDGEDQQIGYRFSCTYSRVKRHVTESCSGSGLDIENQYWLNKKSEIIKSVQWAGMRNGYLLLEGPIFP